MSYCVRIYSSYDTERETFILVMFMKPESGRGGGVFFARQGSD